jgi:hypothetical protein
MSRLRGANPEGGNRGRKVAPEIGSKKILKKLGGEKKKNEQNEKQISIVQCTGIVCSACSISSAGGKCSYGLL